MTARGPEATVRVTADNQRHLPSPSQGTYGDELKASAVLVTVIFLVTLFSTVVGLRRRSVD